MANKRWISLAALLSACGSQEPAPDLQPEPMHGWQRLATAPSECSVQVTDDPAELLALDWKDCPFATDCQWAGAPWAEKAGWGFGGLLSVAQDDGHVYMTWARALGGGAWETVMTVDDRPIAAWRQRQGEPCLVGGPWLTPGGEASLVLLRRDLEHAPWVLHASPDRLSRRPTVAEFGAPGAAVRPRDISAVAADRLLLWEHSGRFAIRDLKTGTTHRPGTRPDDRARDRWMRPTTPGPYGILYQNESGGIGTVRRISPTGDDELVAGGPASFDNAVADGTHAAWTRATNPDHNGAFTDIELWTAPSRGDHLGPPIRIARLPPGPPPLLSIGDGWIAARFDAHDIKLWRITDGPDQANSRRLPTAPDLDYDGGPQGLLLAAGQAWVKASPTSRPGNDVRHLVRFALDALPPTP
jgi:hypothetical protein